MAKDTQLIPPFHRNAAGVEVRLLSPIGFYPATLGYSCKEAAVVVEADLIAVITKFRPLVHPQYFFSEVEILSAFEVQALAPILLARKMDTGSIALYPVYGHYREAGTDVDLSDRRTLTALTERFRRHIQTASQSSGFITAWQGQGRPYNFNEHCEIDRRRLFKLFRAIDVNDHLMIRGLGALLKAGMLSCHSEFLEQACMSLWVSLDASLALVQRKLKEMGYVNPSARDAGEFLDDAFDSQYSSEGYFLDYYDERIKTMHPHSRFGIFPAAPLCADEYFQLNYSLQPLYAFLVTGRVFKEWKRH